MPGPEVNRHLQAGSPPESQKALMEAISAKGPRFDASLYGQGSCPWRQ